MNDKLKALGMELKAAREERELSLHEIANDIKIHERYLAAMEEGKFELLPDMATAGGFIKIYASALNIDGNLLFLRFKSITKSQGSQTMQRKANFIRPLLFILLSLTIIFFLGIFIYNILSGRKNIASYTRKVVIAKKPQPPETVSQQAQTTSPQEETAEEVPQANLHLEATQDAWLEVYSGDHRLHYGLLKMGTTVDFSGESFQITLGNAGVVKVFFKGRELPALGPTGVPVRLVPIPPPAEPQPKTKDENTIIEGSDINAPSD